LTVAAFLRAGVMLLAGGCATAAAQDRPATIPSRDVDVTYGMVGLDQSGQKVRLTQRMRWSAATGKLRVDLPGGTTYMIVDYRGHRLFAVHPAQRAVMEMPADTASVAPGLPQAGAYQRRGDGQLAGLPCGEWDTQDAGGEATTVCLTADGVLLGARRGAQVLVAAQAVTYGPIDLAVFAIPDGYRVVSPPR
jgi:hypothetical protein